MIGPWIFDTVIGRCGIWCGVRGITRVALPEVAGPETDVAPPEEVQDAIRRITALLAGSADDLTTIRLDLDAVPEFHRRVYDATRRIPPGETKTYGEIAGELGDAGAARAVGQALGRNPFPLIVPCHRVLAADGKPGGFSAPGGVDTKMRLLQIEGGLREPTLFDL